MEPVILVRGKLKNQFKKGHTKRVSVRDKSKAEKYKQLIELEKNN